MSLKTSLKVIFLALVLINVVNAHPLGNFSLNQFSQIEVENSRVKIRQVLDIAEIPSIGLLIYNGKRVENDFLTNSLK